MSKPTLPEQLRLAAEIEENNLPWEFKCYGEAEWSSQGSRGSKSLLNLILRDYEIRVKPLEFAPLQAGQEYWNPDNQPPEWFGVREGWRPLLKGEVLKRDVDRLWLGDDDWTKVSGMAGSTPETFTRQTYRTKRPLPEIKPEPKRIPLGPDDILPGSVFRSLSCPQYTCPWTAITQSKVWMTNIMGNPFCLSFESLMNAAWQVNHSVPLTGKWDKTAWEPCSKVETAE